MTPSNSQDALPSGYQLLWYRIERILGRGSFGVTYLATDTNLDRQVAIKEYFPLELSIRTQDLSVQAIGTETGDTYVACLRRFLTEAQTLAKFNHPNIVRVHNVFESNQTAYMVMEYEYGESLDALIKAKGLREEPRILRILHPMLDALEYIHEHGFIHRDVKPSNIFVRENDNPVLLDFGSTRITPDQDSRTLTQLVSRGYAPHEQYSGDAGKQGQWTDIYSLGATIYALACSRSPIDALERANARLEDKKDPLIPASTLCSRIYSARFLQAIDTAMNIIPADRPKSIASLRKLFPPIHSSSTTESSHEEMPNSNAPQYEAISPVPFEDNDFVSLRSDLRVNVDSTEISSRHNTMTSLQKLAIVGLLSIIAISALSWFWNNKPVVVAEEGSKSILTSVKKPSPIVTKPYIKSTQTEISKTKAAETKTTKVVESPRSNRIKSFRDTLAEGSQGPEMVLISFRKLKANTSTDEESPLNTPNPFFLGRYEVTFAEYEQFAHTTNRTLPYDSDWGRDNRPVINISWYDALAYTQWLSEQTGKHYRLPTEAEWKFAAWANAKTSYWWGGDLGNTNANCDGCGSKWDGNMTAPVGSFKPNIFGLFDTAGNVWEWVQDCNIPVNTDNESAQNEQCRERVFLGGSWKSNTYSLVKSKRNADGPELYYRYVGFRVARDI
jgi:serine/threonine protein kinase